MAQDFLFLLCSNWASQETNSTLCEKIWRFVTWSYIF